MFRRWFKFTAPALAVAVLLLIGQPSIAQHRAGGGHAGFHAAPVHPAAVHHGTFQGSVVHPGFAHPARGRTFAARPGVRTFAARPGVRTFAARPGVRTFAARPGVRVAPYYRNGFYRSGYPYYRSWGYWPWANSYPWWGYNNYYYYPQDYSYYSIPYVQGSTDSFYGDYAPDTYDAPDNYVNGTSPLAIEQNAAEMDVRVPADAVIWFNGTKTKQKGTYRQFESPALTPGRSYTYEIRARFMREGQEVDQTRNVTVHAGDRVAVDFLSAPTRRTEKLSSVPEPRLPPAEAEEESSAPTGRRISP